MFWKYWYGALMITGMGTVISWGGKENPLFDTFAFSLFGVLALAAAVIGWHVLLKMLRQVADAVRSQPQVPAQPEVLTEPSVLERVVRNEPKFGD